MLEKYKDSQKLFYDYFNVSYSKNRISHAYLLETNNVSYAFDLAIDLAKFLLCDGVYDAKICELVDNNNYPDFRVVGEPSNVKKGDISSLKESFSRKSSFGKRQVYLIRDVVNINKSAANSLLKFLEEPEGDIVAILLCSNVSSVLPTISSRCQIVKLLNDDDVYKNIFISYYDKSSPSLDFDEFCMECGSNFFDFYSLFENSGTFVLAREGFYELGECVREFLMFGYYLYFDVLCFMCSVDTKYMPDCFNLEDIVRNNSIDDIIRKIDVISAFLYNLRFNVNINLFLDNFIISLDGR